MQRPPPDMERERAIVAITLRKLRERAGISQERLALDASVERAHMGKLENGSNFPRFDTLLRILKRLDASMILFAREYQRNMREYDRTLRLKS